MTRPKRKTFVELVREVGSLSRTRDLSKRKINARKRRDLAPTDAAKATAQMKSAAARYTKQVAAALEMHVLSALPVVGSGDPLNYGALLQGVEGFRARLAELAPRMATSARSAAQKASKHANLEYARITGTRLPMVGVQTGVDAFGELVVSRYAVIGNAQADAIVEAIANYAGEGSVRELLVHQLWVSRNRSQTVARTETSRYFERAFDQWMLRAGEEWGIWVTRRDGDVRHSHRERDGKTFRLSEGLGGIWPGQEANCRCKTLPASTGLV